MESKLNRQMLLQDLTRDEAVRLQVYDDATGQALRPGTTLKGHPTIGIGRALDVHGISVAEAEYLCNNDVDAILSALVSRLPWFAQLDDPRQRALVNVAFNAGVSGLLAFHDMLSALQLGKHADAANCLMQSKLAISEKARAARLRDLLCS